VLVVAVLALAACGGGASTDGHARTVTLYTSVSQETVDAVVAAYERAHPDSHLEVYRAPTGELNARIASEERGGGLEADVIWATDPLSMHAWDTQGLLATDFAPDVDRIPDHLRSDHFWGTRVLDVVIVTREGLRPVPTTWEDLADPAYRDRVEIADPAFAGSAFAALGYFANEPGYGLDFFRRLHENGAVEVSSPTDIVTDVAEGRADLGMTLSFTANTVQGEGSPVRQIWPSPGAIAVYSPIALTASAGARSAAEAFIRYVVSRAGQEQVAASGWQPVLPGITGPDRPAGATEVFPDWPALFEQQDRLLQRYQEIFGP
jgi:iron(III) transport system substrate-binding protein